MSTKTTVTPAISPEHESADSILILFDIDGTLVADQPLTKQCLIDSINLTMGSSLRLSQYSFDGRTDHQNGRALLRLAGADPECIEESLPLVLEDYFANLHQALKITPSNLLPGVVDVLDRLDSEDQYRVALLTGNSERSAALKLASAAIAGRFEFGVYSSDSSDRYALPAIAQKRALWTLERAYDCRQIVVIGDTVHDVGCARAFGALSVGVATGPVPLSVLSSAHPDLLLPSLTAEGSLFQFLEGASNGFRSGNEQAHQDY
ncbi:MAG: HAD hydrolase-like protein [bacterium]|nr:HAD hydrolase-like protein [bacterium]